MVVMDEANNTSMVGRGPCSLAGLIDYPDCSWVNMSPSNMKHRARPRTLIECGARKRAREN